MAFIQISDFHFIPAGETLYGLSPADRLAPAIELINREHGDAAFVLVTGDLTHSGQTAAYEALRGALGTCQIPVHLMMGNHDRRAPFRAVFGDAPAGEDFVQFVLHDGETPVVCLDTLIDEDGHSEGALCPRRLDWLRAQISRIAPGQAWLLALHHPPMALDLPSMDRIRLLDSEALYEVLKPHPPAMMLMGHVHRPVHGTWRGIPFHIQRGINHQVAWSASPAATLAFQDEPPEFSLVAMTGEGPLIHTRGYLSEGPAFPKS